jgi:hypothetical protein
MCIAFDGAYILEAPTTHPASTDEHRQVLEPTTDDADTESTERPVRLDPALR